MRKNIVVAGFSKDQRDKELEKMKMKYDKKGYTYIDYVDNGTLKSVAVFEVNEGILRKEKSQKLFIVSASFLVIALILYIRAS